MEIFTPNKKPSRQWKAKGFDSCLDIMLLLAISRSKILGPNPLRMKFLIKCRVYFVQ